MEQSQDRALGPWRIVFRPSVAYRVIVGVLGILFLAFALWRIWQAVGLGMYREVAFTASFSFIWTFAILSIFYRVEISSDGLRTRRSPLLYPSIWTLSFNELESVTVKRGIMGVVVSFRLRYKLSYREIRGYSTGFYRALAEIRSALPSSIPVYDPDGVFAANSTSGSPMASSTVPRDR